MVIETKSGPMDESQLVKVGGMVETATEIKGWVEYRLPDTGEVMARFEGGGFAKSNVFATPTAPSQVIATIRGEMSVSDLRRRLISIDDANEFTSIVEYRAPGSDEILHRSVDVKLKRQPEMGGIAGGIG